MARLNQRTRVTSRSNSQRVPEHPTEKSFASEDWAFRSKIWFFTTIHNINQDPITSSEMFNFRTLSEALQSDTESTETNNTVESKQPAT